MTNTNNIQHAIIASLIMKPSLVYNLNGVQSFLFDEGNKQLFELVVKQINESAKVDIPLLNQKCKSISISELIEGVNPSSFAQYTQTAIEDFKREQEMQLGIELQSNLQLMPYIEAVSIHEKGRGLINEMFTSGVSDKDKDLLDAMNDKYNHTEPTQYAEINNLTRGFMIGGYDIFAARPAMGKTTLMIDLALGLAKKGIPACIISLEMSKKAIYSNISCRLSGVRKSTVRRDKKEVAGLENHYQDEHDAEMERYYKAFDKISNLPIFVYDINDCTNKLSGIVNLIRVVNKKHNVDYFFIDYLQKISASNEKSRNYQIEEISGDLSRLPIQLNCYIGAFSQLSRALETRGGAKRPNMSDLRDGGAIEQDAWNIYMLYRPEYYNILEDELGKSLKKMLELIVVKNREYAGEGGLGSAYLWFNTSKQGYVNDQYETLENETKELAYNGTITKSNGISNDEDIPF